MNSMRNMLPLFGIQIGVGIVGFLLSILWMKRRAPTDTDSNTVSFLVKMWTGIVLGLFVVDYFI